MSEDPPPPDHPLAVFHHEAGTPVALIGAVLRQLDRSDAIPEEHRELVTAALRQLEVLQRLLDQLRVADQERLQLELRELDLAELVGEVVDDLGDSVLADHPCHVEAPAGAVTVPGDGPSLRQLLTNLLDNAAKYSPAGTDIHVHVEDHEDHVVLAVTDGGTGIGDPDLVRIFRRYERASEDTDGLGLGLYVVWRIVEAHGGEVRAEQAPNGPGSRFVVRLPRAGA